MISITQSAAKQIKSILAEHPNKLLKVGVQGGGCSGFTYESAWNRRAWSGPSAKSLPSPAPATSSPGLCAMDLISEGEILSDDERVSENGVEIVLDGVSIMYLIGTELDYKVDLVGSQFVFNNPSAVSQCGCGTSFSI